MTDDEYAKLLARLYREGQIHLANGGNLLAASRLTMGQSDSENSILCFEGFMYLKDKIRDYCAGPPPAIVTYAAAQVDTSFVRAPMPPVTMAMPFVDTSFTRLPSEAE